MMHHTQDLPSKVSTASVTTWRGIAMLLLSIVCFFLDGNQANANEKRPNVLIMMVDDLGFSDLGCYGSEIETPNLDQLAADGVRFSQFYNTAKCHSSRVSLLTGQYCYAAGNTNLSHGITSAETLGANGYFTAMTGKWHLQKEPTDFGFKRYFGHLSGACNYFVGDNTFRMNGEPWQVPEDNFYTTVANVDFAIQFLREARRDQQPWYLYVAFNAPHAPLHALPEDFDKYKGRYESGWDQTREARFLKQKKLGIFSESTVASPRPNHIPPWEELTNWRKNYEAQRMSTLAAMIDRVDQEVGRLVENLRNSGELENTFILFVSDNGACPYDRKRPLLNITPTNGREAFGDSTGWAWARNTPFRYYKQNQFEGGIATPAIAHWPAGIKKSRGSVIHEAAHLIDVLPTISEISKSQIPDSWPDRELRNISGQSLVPLLSEQPFNRKEPLHFLFSSDRGLRDQNWKIVSFRQEPWELYDLSKDRTELNNLAKIHPERLQQMIDQWTKMSKDLLQGPASSYAPVRDQAAEHRHREWTQFANDQPGGPTPPRTTNREQKKDHIRARKNTKMDIRGSVINLVFSGEDPGIAMDLRSQQLPAGPYSIRFRLKQSGENRGEVFFTTTPKAILPRGQRLEFAIENSSTWQVIEVPIDTKDRIYQVRIDLSDQIGKATLDQLELVDADGKTLISWPKD